MQAALRVPIPQTKCARGALLGASRELLCQILNIGPFRVRCGPLTHLLRRGNWEVPQALKRLANVKEQGKRQSRAGA